MHILVRWTIIISLLWVASANAQFNGCPPGFCNLSAGTTPADNALLLEDNVSNLQLEDGVSNLCLESGC